MALVIFHLQDAKGNPLGGVIGDSTGGPGPWSAQSNPCGDMKTDLQGYVSDDEPTTHYEIVFRKPGYLDRTLPADIGDSGIIYVGLETDQQIIPVPPVGPLPPIPTRAQVCAVQHSLAGLTYHTKQYGDVPAWFYGALSAEDRAEARACHRAAGDTHIPFPLTEAYREGGTLWPAALADGYDYTSNDGLNTYRAIATEIIADGFFIDAPMGGDGLGSGPDYNDPVGRTYGHQWLMANLERMLRAVQGDGTTDRPDLTPYIIWRPGWDAVFYSWGGSAQMSRDSTGARVPLRWWRQRVPLPAQLSAKALDDQQMRVKNFGELFRRILPNGYLAIEHTPGNIPVGEGGGDYQPGGLMTTFDTIMGEYDTFHQDSYWQIGGRMLRPWHRPPDQTAGDDPNPPFYLSHDSPRGPFFYVVFEPTRPGVYEWCRGRCTREQMQQEDAYIRASGATLTGYPVHW